MTIRQSGKSRIRRGDRDNEFPEEETSCFKTSTPKKGDETSRRLGPPALEFDRERPMNTVCHHSTPFDPVLRIEY